MKRRHASAIQYSFNVVSMFSQEYAALAKVGQNFVESVNNKLFTVLLNQQQKSTNNISSRSDIG